MRGEELRITELRFDWAVTLVISGTTGTYEVRLEREVRLGARHGEVRTIDPEGEPASLAPLLGLLRAEVEEIRVFSDGRLRLAFPGGTVLEVRPDNDFEAWTLTGTSGLLFVAVPGGGVAVWS
ncbi:DUF6188 family protein [Streptoalloteichus hindustanus]|uniref:DUF6188 family protein n=1 Tax=Streptoalloteichus hindustanus TaxID=2017 RepID=UPI00116129F4|nr:DUF6188 family protein [Streptoalloteichus hindustanus]